MAKKNTTRHNSFHNRWVIYRLVPLLDAKQDPQTDTAENVTICWAAKRQSTNAYQSVCQGRRAAETEFTINLRRPGGGAFSWSYVSVGGGNYIFCTPAFLLVFYKSAQLNFVKKHDYSVRLQRASPRRKCFITAVLNMQQNRLSIISVTMATNSPRTLSSNRSRDATYDYFHARLICR